MRDPQMVIDKAAIDVAHEISIHGENAVAVTGYRHSHQQDPVSNQQRSRHNSSRNPPGVEKESRCQQVNDGDSLQNSGNAGSVPVEPWIGVEKKAERKYDGAALNRVQKQRSLRVATSGARSK